MKKISLLLLSVSLSYFVIAQESTHQQEPIKQKEVGLAFSNLDNFGFTYKFGTDKSLWRLNTLFLRGNHMEMPTDSILNVQNELGFGVKFGKEYRKEIVENLEFRYGADLSFNYSASKSEIDDRTLMNMNRLHERKTYSPGINLVLGLNYVVKDKLVIGAEILPNFSYSTTTQIQKTTSSNYNNEVRRNITGFNYGFSSSSLLLSIAYRIR